MAEKRMFTKKITDSDAFTEMSSAAQSLYFHLNQGADDDGFNNQIQMAMTKAHASADDLKILMAKNFIIRFESGVIVIKHWRMHNTLRKDRYKPTDYEEEFEMLGIKNNGVYTLGCQTVAKRLPQSSIDKNSIDKVSVVEGSACDHSDTTENNTPVENSVENSKLKCQNGQLGKGVVFLSDEQFNDLLDKLGVDAFDRYVARLADFIIEKNAYVQNHYKTILKWWQEDSKVI